MKNKEVVTAQTLPDTEVFAGHSEKVTVIVSQPEHIAQIKKLIKKYPEECEVIEATEDESVCVRIPMAWVEIKPEETDK